MEVLRKYGEATVVSFPLVDAGSNDFESTPVTFAAGDTQIAKDEGAFANTTNNPAHEGNGIYSLSLTATEMQAARIVVTIIDSATKAWEDQSVIISTYGNASAQHAFDLDSATVNLSSTTETQIDAIETDTNELQTDDVPGLIAALNDPSAASIADAVWDEASAGHTDAGKAGQQLWTDLDAVLADTNELQTDDVPGLIAALNDPSAASIADAVWDEASAGHTDAGKAGQQLWTDLDAVLADTNELQTDDVPGLISTAEGNIRGADSDTLETLSDQIDSIDTSSIADAVWDEATSGHTAAGSTGKALTDGITAGAGATTFTYTLTSSVDGTPIADADVWATSDQAGSNVLASGTTDSNGQVTFYLDAGTVYIWRQKSGWNFTNPDTETVS